MNVKNKAITILRYVIQTKLMNDNPPEGEITCLVKLRIIRQIQM